MTLTWDTNPAHVPDPALQGIRRGSAATSAAVDSGVVVSYQPILDVARGIAAGYQTVVSVDPRTTRSSPANEPEAELEAAVAAASTALSEFPNLPTNTFISIPVPLKVLGHDRVRRVLRDHGDLAGVVLDVTEFSTGPFGELGDALEAYREAGALIAVGGQGAAQPELTSIVRLKPAIIRLGRAWVRGVDQSEAKRSAIEVTGRLAGQLDAWILAEGVSTSAELRALAGLDVPLAQGPFVGEPQQFWPDIELTARTVLPRDTFESDGVLRGLLQQAYTARDITAAAAILPETTGFDVLVVLDERRRPTSLLEHDGTGRWDASAVLSVNIDTPVADAVSRAMARPRTVRFTPLVCTDAAGRFLGILRIESLMEHLTNGAPA